MTDEELAEWNRANYIANLDERHDAYVVIQDEPPRQECFAVAYCGMKRQRLGRFYPTTPPRFAPCAASPEEFFDGDHRVLRARVIDPKRACVFEVVKMGRKLFPRRKEEAA